LLFWRFPCKILPCLKLSLALAEQITAGIKNDDNKNRAVRWINSSNTQFIRLYIKTVLTAS
jgi:hypothetical protein